MGKAVFIYDGECGFCIDSVRWLEGRGAARDLRFEPFQSEPDEMARAGIAAEDCRRAAYVVDDRRGPSPRIHRGAGAVSYALRRLPGIRRLGWRLLGCVYLVPVIKQIEDAGYGWIARNRYRLRRSGDAR